MRDDPRQYYVYILASKSRTLYIGITRHLAVRIAQHKAGDYGAFTSRYGEAPTSAKLAVRGVCLLAVNPVRLIYLF